MTKRLNLAVAAAVVALIAFALPTVANAATGLTTGGSPGGTLVPRGTKLLQTNVGGVTITTTKVGNIECGAWTMESEVTEDSESTGTQSVGVGEGTAGACNVGENPATITHIKLATIKSSASESETAKTELSFEADLPGSVTCKFSAVTGGSGITYITHSHITTYTKAPFNVSPAGCGKATIDANFTTETTGKAAVFIM